MVMTVFVVLVVLMMMLMVVLLSHSLAATALLILFIDGIAERLPLLLVPCAQALPAKHEIFIIDDDRLHPGMTAVLLVGHLDVGEVVVLRVVWRRVDRRRRGNHFERRWAVVVLRRWRGLGGLMQCLWGMVSGRRMRRARAGVVMGR